MTQHPIDELAAYALGDLDTATAREVLAHADACPACAAVLAESMRGVGALAETEGQREGRALRQPARRWRPSVWVAGVSAAAAVVLAGWNIDLRLEGAPPVEALVHSHFTHHPLTGTGGNAKLITALDGSWVYVVADGLQPLRSYQLQVDGLTVGDVRADAAGRATGYWNRGASAIASASLSGPGTSLLWREK